MNYVVIHHFIKEGITKEMMQPHLQYLKKLIQSGKLIITGPFNDKKRGGMYIIDVENEDELNTIVNNDPAITSGLAESEVRPYKIFYKK